jgi:hypothetical protein
MLYCVLQRIMLTLQNAVNTTFTVCTLIETLCILSAEYIEAVLVCDNFCKQNEQAGVSKRGMVFSVRT